MPRRTYSTGRSMPIVSRVPLNIPLIVTHCHLVRCAQSTDKEMLSHRDTLARERVFSTTSTGYCRRHEGQCITLSLTAAAPPLIPFSRLLPVAAREGVGGGPATPPLPFFLPLPLPPPVFALEIDCSTPSSASCAAMTSSGLGGGLRGFRG